MDEKPPKRYEDIDMGELRSLEDKNNDAPIWNTLFMRHLPDQMSDTSYLKWGRDVIPPLASASSGFENQSIEERVDLLRLKIRLMSTEEPEKSE